jgi:hypothetical protein
MCYSRSVVIDHLQRHRGNAALGFMYFNYKQHRDQSVHMLLSSLLKQLYDTLPEVFVDTEGLYELHQRHCTSPKREELEEVLRTGITRCHEAYFVLDALDEYLENFSEQAIGELLSVLQGLGGKIKLMVTSRVLGGMESIFEQIQAERLEICPVEDDLRRYIRARIERDFQARPTEDLSEELVQKVVEIAKDQYVLFLRAT